MRKASLMALGASFIILAGIVVAARSDSRPSLGRVVSADGQRFSTLIPSAQGALEPCAVCHRIDADGPESSGPSLWGIVDAEKARSTWFGYSPALAAAQGTWSATEIDSYLADPVAYLPGTSKTLSRVRAADERKAIIAALEKLDP